MEHSENMHGDVGHSDDPCPRAESYPFLNHSSTTLPNNLPPSVDDKPLARQKRKRTSPEDQAILEAAYNRDCKPDKEARLELVKQVALGEKEVQIWFQNRRQTSRRKSRPLLPHEIAQYHLARNGFSYLPLELDAEPISDSSPFSTLPTSNNHADSSNFERIDASSSPAVSQSHSTDDSVVSSRISSQMVAAGDSAPLPFDSQAPVAYLANRRSAPSLRPDAPIERHVLPWSRPAQNTQPKGSASLVRISLTGDGKAQIVTKDSSPSPPRPLQPPAESLDGTTKPQLVSQEPLSHSNHPESRPLHRSSSARSRDSRTWEFWCDKEARNELGNKAEKDASGSAADAIDLLRSTSGRRVLGALSARSNNALSRHASFLQRKHLGAKPPGLQKFSTSLGRLQSSSKSAGKGIADKISAHNAGGDVRIPGNDSDKENWSPRSVEHSQSSANDRYGSVDETSHSKHSGMQQASKQDRYPDAARKGLGSNIHHQDRHVDNDPEIAAFMRGQRKTTSFSEAEDLDCIQGLLSLSQGNWR